MNQPLTLVIDQGTHATRALALDQEGQVQATAYREIALYRHAPAFIEQDANEILASLDDVLENILADPVVRRAGIAQAGLASQRSSVVAWDKSTGEPLGPMLSWQDRRAHEWLSKFDSYKNKVKQHTGLPLSPHYGASKLRWYLDHLPAVNRAWGAGNLAFGPWASFVLFHLLSDRPLIVDHANASRTILWNIQSRDWDPWLLELFNLPRQALPDCRPICHPYGVLRAANIPLTAVNGDQNSALYSLGRPRRNTGLINIGTGAFILLPTGNQLVQHPTLLSSLGSSDESQAEYIIEGTVNGAGAALDWAAAKWNLPDFIEQLPNWLSRSEEPPLFINTIGGLGSPWWCPGPPPELIGSAEPWLGMVAVVESILFLLQINYDTIRDAGLEINRLQVTGGLARLDGVCQRLADLTQKTVYRPAETEATARGVAWLAAGRPRRWPKPGRGVIFRPQANDALVERYQRFHQYLKSNVGDHSL
jgi:glycerol kinase